VSVQTNVLGGRFSFLPPVMESWQPVTRKSTAATSKP